MWYNRKFFRYSVGILLTLLIIYMLGKIDFFLSPFKQFISTLFTPILVGGLLYYILRPLVSLLVKYRVPRVLSILITFVVVLATFGFIGTYTSSIIVSQFNELIRDLPSSFDSARRATDDLINNPWLKSISNGELERNAARFLEEATQSLSKFIFSVLSAMANIGTLLLVVPFILFYFLKDGHLFTPGITKLVPRKHAKNIEKILKDIDTALSSYILGQMMVALFVGTLMFIGYLIIGLKYSLVLAFFAMLTCVIPFFGPWIGIIPAVLVGMTDSSFMILKILIVMQVVQQIEGNFISPQIFRKQLDIHPLTVILLLMGSVTIAGFVGLIVAIPTYAALKVTIVNVLKMYPPKFLDID